MPASNDQWNSANVDNLILMPGGNLIKAIRENSEPSPNHACLHFAFFKSRQHSRPLKIYVVSLLKTFKQGYNFVHIIVTLK